MGRTNVGDIVFGSWTGNSLRKGTRNPEDLVGPHRMKTQISPLKTILAAEKDFEYWLTFSYASSPTIESNSFPTIYIHSYLR